MSLKDREALLRRRQQSLDTYEEKQKERAELAKQQKDAQAKSIREMQWEAERASKSKLEQLKSQDQAAAKVLFLFLPSFLVCFAGLVLSCIHC